MLRAVAASPRTSGPWDAAAMASFLTHEVIPVRLATTGRSGPIVQSMWFDFADGFVWCSTQADSSIVGRLRHDPRVGFEVSRDAAPYRGVRGRAIGDIVHIGAAEVLDRIVDRYVDDPGSPVARRLRSRRTSEVALRLNPLTLHSWDHDNLG